MGCDNRSENQAIQIANAACTRFVECRANLTCSDCRSGFLQTVPVKTSSGALLGTLQDVADNLEAKTVGVQTSSSDVCKDHYTHVSCTDVDALSGVDDPYDFSEINDFLIQNETRCIEVFTF